MNRLAIAVIILWMVLAVVNILGIWFKIPVLIGAFGVLNIAIIASLIPVLIQEIKLRKAEKKEKKIENELQLQK